VFCFLRFSHQPASQPAAFLSAAAAGRKARAARRCRPRAASLVARQRRSFSFARRAHCCGNLHLLSRLRATLEFLGADGGLATGTGATFHQELFTNTRFAEALFTRH